MDARERPPQRNWLARTFDRLRQLVWAALILGLAALAVRELVVKLVDEKIREKVLVQLQAVCPEHLVSIQSARRVEGKGIEVRGLLLVEPGMPTEQALLEADEILVVCDPAWNKLLELQVERVKLRRVRCRIERRTDGTWNIATAFRRPTTSRTCPPIDVEEGELHVFDHGPQSCLANCPSDHGGGAEQVPAELRSHSATLPAHHHPLVFRNVRLGITTATTESLADGPAPSAAGPVLSIRGTVGGDHLEQATFDGVVDPVAGTWSMRGTLDGFDFSPRLHASVPKCIAERIAPLAALQARADLRFHLASPAAPGEACRFVVAGRMVDGRLDDARLPSPLTQLQAELYCDHEGVRIKDLTAQAGGATIGLSCQYDLFDPLKPLRLFARARKLAIDEKLLGLIPANLRERLAAVSISGPVDLDLSLTFDGREWLPELTVDCHGLDFACRQFPVAFTEIRGRLHLRDGVLQTRELRATVSGETLAIDGELRWAAGPQGIRPWGWCEIMLANPIPFDDHLVDAIGVEFPKAAKVLRSMRPRGMATMWGRFEKAVPDAPKVQTTLRVGLHDSSIKYDKFAYPLEKIAGEVRFEQGVWKFDGLSGRNGSAYVVCDGTFRKLERGGQLDLRFTATDVPLDDDLRQALKPAMQETWSRFRPRGTLDHLVADVRFTSATDALDLALQLRKWPPKQNVEGRSITIEPTFFPYRLDSVTGEAHYRNGTLDLVNLHAQHGFTTVRCGGQCLIRDGAWSVRFPRFTVQHLAADRDLLTACPPQLAKALTKLRLHGPLHLDGPVEIARPAPNAPLRMAWETNVDVEDGSFYCGRPVEHVRGGVRLVGGFDERGFRSRGELNIDSLIVFDQQLTQVRGPIWLDETQVLLGNWAEQREPSRRREPDPRTASRPITAKLFRGAFACDARVPLNEQDRFDLQLVLNEGDLGEIARETMPRGRRLSGRAFAFARLNGTQKGLHTLRGDGQLRLRDADLYEVPVMVALLSLLKLSPPDTTAFTTCNVDFHVEAEHIYLPRIEFNGDVISLKGNGEVALDRQVNINFYTLVGRGDRSPPIIGPLFRAASEQMLLIHVGGTLDRPDLTRKAFPQLEETIQQIFPEATNRRAAAKSPGATR